MKGLRRTAGWLMVVALGGATSPAGADVVTDWNAIAAQSILVSPPASPARGGGSAFLDFAMVHLAMHDAIQAFEKRYESYGPRITNAAGSAVAAAATAAHDSSPASPLRRRASTPRSTAISPGSGCWEIRA